ncbi:MAG: response regulator [Acholeplasmatales bacterium]|nr:response regulator [Acholeplasmatales bacterium]
MKILLVDDEKLQLIRLLNTVKKVLPDSEILSYTNPVLAFKENENNLIDIAFLDIEMPEINGIQLAKKLKKINPKINVIFVTAYDNYALDAYKLHASGYVTKPVNEKKVKDELEGLRYDVELKPSKKLQVKCFGNFEVFYNGVPLKFARSKSKELFAYLIDREGAAINVNELNAVLWEDDDHKSYFRNLVSDITATLKSVGLDDVFIKRHNECFIDISKVDCDAYEYKNNNPDAIRAYRGEYMMQYSWPIFNADKEQK